MNTRFLAVPVATAALAALSLSACGGHHATALARPTSSAVAAAEAQGKTLIQACQPKGETTSAWEASWIFHFQAARKAFLDCEKIPQPKRQAALSCVLNAAKANFHGPGGKSAREARFLAAGTQCVKTARQ